MKNLAYYNGKIAPIDEMMIPMNDRVCYFGDGVYEATMVNNRKIFALQEHIDRFFSSAEQVRIKLPYTKQELAEILCGLVEQVDDPEQMLYWQATRGTAPRNHVFPEDLESILWVNIKPMKVKDQAKRLALTEAEDTRFLHCNIKTLNLMINCLAATRAEEMGCDESVFHRGELVTECAHSNVSIIKDGMLITHPADNLILPGITRKHVIEICGEYGIPVEERAFTMEELRGADEVLVTSSTQLCRGAGSLDGKPIGGKAPEILKKIQDAYMEKYLRETR